VEEADVLLWHPTPSMLYLGGWPTTTVLLYADMEKVGLLPIGGSVGGMRSSALIFLLCTQTHRADMDVVPSPSLAGAHEEAFWSLAVLVVVLLMRRLLMRVFSGDLGRHSSSGLKMGR
jgi:hypothetical protein